MLQHITEGLFKSFLVITTVEKAKETRAWCEPLITCARKGDPQSQRQVLAVIKDKVAYKTLFDKLGPHFKDRNCGYTRILLIGRRPGDGAEQAVLELVDREKLGPPPGKPTWITKEAREKAGGATK